MSLSSYSLVLMAIAYLQHAGIVPNLQDNKLITQYGIKRETFWSKVPNPDAPKASHWTKRKFLGDYKAMAVDTTFVKAVHVSPKADVQASTMKANGSLKKPKPPTTGWESGSETPVERRSDEPAEQCQLLNLIEGFFEYYLGFPTENKAISVWRGKPIDRKVPFDPAVQRSRKSRRHSRKTGGTVSEQSGSEESAESDTLQRKADDGRSPDSVNGARILSDSETTATSEATTITDDEELRALYEKVEGTMRKLGVKDSTPSFELTLKSNKPPKKTGLQPINGPDQAQVSILPAMQEIDALEQIEECDFGDAAHRSAHKGLDPSQASPETNLFPIPPVEDPESFVEPPTWTQPLVVQDPFIHTRNTTMNIVPETVALIWKVG